ncbi:MAG: hypothetical protein ACPGQM_00285 [Alphaproteobacteria bacterium]
MEQTVEAQLETVGAIIEIAAEFAIVALGGAAALGLSFAIQGRSRITALAW